jgi:DNA-binding transcriptional regulator GbsR (MarR family)
MAAEDAEGRQSRIEKAYVQIERLQTKLQGKRCRLRLRERVEEAAQKILKGAGRRARSAFWISLLLCSVTT